MSAAPDLSEARRLLGMGFKLVEMVPFTKQPNGQEWNRHPITDINPRATGYGIILAQNKLCSIDPDNWPLAKRGMAALGFDLDELMNAGVRTVSTRPGSGGRSTFVAEGDLEWIKFRSKSTGTVIEFRANSPNLQDCIPGLLYKDKTGRVCSQQYANGKRLDDAPPLPDRLLDWWERCSMELDFLHEQERKFFAALETTPQHSLSTGKGTKLAYPAPRHRTAYNTEHTVEELLERHGYSYDRRLDRWAPPTATGEPGVRRIPGKNDLWHSDHASDPLAGTFDAWVACVTLEHDGDVEKAKKAVEAEGLLIDFGRDGEPAAEEPAKEVSLFVTADTLRGSAFKAPEPIIEGLLLPGATLVHGPAKKGKSWFLMQMGLAIHSGESFLGRNVSRRDCLYIGAEDTNARLKSRLERMFASGSLKFMNREGLEAFGRLLRRSLGEEPVTAQLAVERLWEAAGRPSVVIIDTQEVFEIIVGITHGKPGDSVTRRDYKATSSYDGLALKLGIAIVLVGHWGELKSIQKATINPHECLNTTKARLAGVTTSITLGPLPNQQPGEATSEMQLSIRSRDAQGGDQFLWLTQDSITGTYTCLGTVNDVLLTEAQTKLFEALADFRKEGGGDAWAQAADLAEALDCSPQNVKQMVSRVRKAAKAQGRKPMYQGFELESKPKMGYRLK